MSVQWTPLRLVVGDSTEKKLSEERRNNNISTSKFASQVDVYAIRQGGGHYAPPFNNVVLNGHANMAEGEDEARRGQGDFSSQPTLPSEYRKAINEKHRTRSVVLTKADLEPTPRTKTDGSEPATDIYIKKCRDSKPRNCNGGAYPPLPVGPSSSQENIMEDKIETIGKVLNPGDDEPQPPPKRVSSIEKIPWEDMTDDASHKSLDKYPKEEDDRCIVNCLYYTMQCCECVIM